MRAFHFRLQRLLELRSHRLEQAERLLAEQVGRCQRLENAILDRRRLQRENRLEFAEADFRERWAVERYVARLEHEIKALEVELAKALEERERAAAAYRTALAEKKSLQNLRDKREQRFRKEARRREFLLMDDQTQSSRGAR